MRSSTCAGQKDPTKELEDLQKAEWYLKREIERIAKGNHDYVRQQLVDEYVDFCHVHECETCPLGTGADLHAQGHPVCEEGYHGATDDQLVDIVNKIRKIDK